ncbi:hypothetical protein [Streptomyces sp. MMBL 11-1]|uniref:hypothetical protein n=1 Tax=Streptomyces sp. MMBL 11-1 TaxID=3026420 RepID=UPI0023606051|nr:hypothetical protein [Streptomyces sp. MMBL 11-1]
MPTSLSSRTAWCSLPELQARAGARCAPAASPSLPSAVEPVTAVALYAVVPVPGVEDLVLDDLAVYADARGWTVPSGCAVTDPGTLDQDTELRAGWSRIREAATGGRISGVVVPSFAHIAYRWNEWNNERAWLLRQGLFVIATDPTVTVGLEPEELWS